MRSNNANPIAWVWARIECDAKGDDMSKRTRLIQGLKLCVLPWVLGAALTATAQDFPPKKSITMVVGFAAGGASDTGARIIAKKLGDNIGATVVIDNEDFHKRTSVPLAFYRTE